ncbi:unnamed protein product [Echinostoma caproni]|uniref:Uncharacterized protein n=1 Tax=Echinostoma caproni TaxID=27848 RepID=A0A183A5X5_9TREM|nr:unnamed protein product [Echinostoma caproni]
MRTVSPIPQDIREKLLPICVPNRTDAISVPRTTESTERLTGPIAPNQLQLTKATVHGTATSDSTTWNLQGIDSGIPDLYTV